MKSQKTENENPGEPARDPDLAGAEAAMRRAAERARRRAADSGGTMAVFEDERIVWVKADGEAAS